MIDGNNHNAVRKHVKSLPIALRVVADVVARVDHDIRVDDRAPDRGAASDNDAWHQHGFAHVGSGFQDNAWKQYRSGNRSAADLHSIRNDRIYVGISPDFGKRSLSVELGSV